MLLSLLLPTALAAAPTVLPTGPVVADGDTPVRVHVHVEGVVPGDRVRLKPFEGSASGAAVTAPGIVSFSYLPPYETEPGEARVRMIIKGELKLDETIDIPFLAVPRSGLDIEFSESAWQLGKKGSITVTVKPTGSHPLPSTARSFDLDASTGKLGPLTRSEDGSWTATWTPPTTGALPQHALFVATDSTDPGSVVGWGAFPLLVEKEQKVKAAKGSQNVLVIGEAQYGPITAADDNSFAIQALLDPRVQQATLQSVDETGYRSDTTVQLDLGSPAVMALAPLPDLMPSGQDLRLLLALIEPDGTAWSGAAPKLEDGPSAESLGGGWYAFDVTSPEDPGDWTVRLTGAEDLVLERTFQVVDAAPSVTVSSDPAALRDGETQFTVTTGLKDAEGQALVKRVPVFDADGAAALGRFKDNGDGTYTQKYKLAKGGDAATIRTFATTQATGLPTAKLVIWPRQPSVANDGSSTLEIAVVALDAYGVPVPRVELGVTSPVGDGSTAPTVTTDKHGFAVIEYRAGVSEGPSAIVASASGVEAATLFWQGEGGTIEPSGTDLMLADAAQWRAATPAVTISVIGSDVGPPENIAIRTTPGYTTPGAAILVTVSVTDGAGKAVLDAQPRVTASLGKVGSMTTNGDGSYNVPLQLPPGQDGPVNLQVVAGEASRTLKLPTLASMGSGEDSSSQASDGGSEGGDDYFTQSATATANLFVNDKPRHHRVRVYGMGQGYRYRSFRFDEGDEPRIPTDFSFSAGLPSSALGGGISANGHPGGNMVGYDVRLRSSLYSTSLGADPYLDGLPMAMAGMRAKTELSGGLDAYAAGWAHLLDVPIYRYTDEIDGLDRLNKYTGGLRVGGGVTFTKRWFHAQIELAETFGPLPKQTSAGLLLEGNIPIGPVSAIVFLDEQFDAQHMRFHVGTGDSRDGVKIRSTLLTTQVGVGVAF
jgi:hypothetical protein